MKKIILPENFEIDRIEGNEIILKEKKQLPKTWKEFCEQNPIDTTNTIIDKFGIISSASADKLRKSRDIYTFNDCKQAEAIITFIKLIQLRDCYRQGWTPKPGISHYIITPSSSNWFFIETSVEEHIFSFETYKIAKLFYSTFEYLFKKIKYLYEY